MWIQNGKSVEFRGKNKMWSPKLCSDKLPAEININVHFYIMNAIFIKQETTNFWGPPDPVWGFAWLHWGTLVPRPVYGVQKVP